MTTPRWWRRIKALGACEEALAWARRYRTYRGMIRGCKRRDWLEWLLDRTIAPRDDYFRACDAANARYERARGGAAALAVYTRTCLSAARAACLGLEVNRA